MAISSHPLGLLLALLFVMLFVSPLARSHTSDLCFGISEKLLRHYVLAHEQISGDHQLKQTLALENSKLRAGLDKTKAHLTTERNRVAQLEKDVKRRNTFFNALQDTKGLDRMIESQSDEIAKLKGIIANLNMTIDSKTGYHHSEVTDLKFEIDKLETTCRTTQKCLADSSQEHISLRDEIDRLRSQLSTQTAQHQASLVKLKDNYAHEIHPYKGAVETLFKLSEGTGDHLTAAAIFADALKCNGVNLARLGIDERRAQILCEFVRRGQSPYDLVQPQAAVLGFSLNPPRAPIPAPLLPPCRLCMCQLCPSLSLSDPGCNRTS
jgi:predicted  nucleic acid-binding Zn-ribbon protein